MQSSIPAYGPAGKPAISRRDAEPLGKRVKTWNRVGLAASEAAILPGIILAEDFCLACLSLRLSARDSSGASARDCLPAQASPYPIQGSVARKLRHRKKKTIVTL
jgi:hypothetical protein